MTHRDFMVRLIEYYGKYKLKAVGELTYLHIMDNVAEVKLPALLQHLNRTIPAKYDYVPDISAIDQALKDLKSVDEREVPAYKKLPMPSDEEFDKVGAFWKKLREKYPSKRSDDREKLEAAKRELEEHRRNRDD